MNYHDLPPANQLTAGGSVKDELRDDQRVCLGCRQTAIEAIGLRTLLFTGDSEVMANAVGVEIRVDGIQAELLPNDKVERFKSLLVDGSTVAVVGDGINDAPAPMQASVGIAMAPGTDVARESADVMLIGNDLMTVVNTLALARRCHRIIIVNFAGTIAVDGLGIGLDAVGLLNPLLAAFIQVSSELAFILNSARLFRHSH